MSLCGHVKETVYKKKNKKWLIIQNKDERKKVIGPTSLGN